MFKLTIEQILASISALTPEEKEELKQKLPSVLSTSSASTSSGQSMTNTLGNVTFGTGNSAFNFQPTMAGNDAVASPSFAQSSTEQQDLLEALQLLRQTIQGSGQLSSLTKLGAEAEVDKLANEAQKKEPDKGLITQTIAALRQGLQGVQELATPVATVASLVAKAWGIPVP